MWILPLKPMHDQYRTTCSSHNLESESWSKTMSASTPPLHILVQIEDTISNTFRAYLETIVSAGRLARIIVDEAHLFVAHKTFRKVMDTLSWAGSQNVQLAFLSGSLPVALERELFKTFGVTSYVSCREETPRKNISYNVIKTETVDAVLDEKVREVLSQSETDKVLIFTRTTEEAEQVAQRLDIPFCHSKMDEEQQQRVLDDLREGKCRAVACTILLGASLHVPDVNVVFHRGYPYNTIGYLQESGRAGRVIGSKGYSYVIVDPRQSNPNRVAGIDWLGAQLIYDWVNDDVHCRRLLPQTYNDGTAKPCSMLDRTTHLCDVCRRSYGTVPQRNEASQYSPDIIRPYLPPCESSLLIRLTPTHYVSFQRLMFNFRHFRPWFPLPSHISPSKSQLSKRSAPIRLLRRRGSPIRWR